jgi:hypothetical protein
MEQQNHLSRLANQLTAFAALRLQLVDETDKRNARTPFDEQIKRARRRAAPPWTPSSQPHPEFATKHAAKKKKSPKIRFFFSETDLGFI